jgi:hypothetical protein
MRNAILRGAVLAIGALSLGFGPGASADQGSAVIDSKQPDAVMLNGSPYRISDATVLEDKEGNRLGYAQLPTREQGASVDDASAWYEASDDERSPVLYRLKLTGAQPR